MIDPERLELVECSVERDPQETMVCKCERAESNGWEILGPADVSEPGCVRVPADDYRATPDADMRDGVTAK